jgi:pimeloyl-ACP methyl ester carboxylesterase
MACGVSLRVAATVALALLTASCGDGGQQSATRLRLSACTLQSVAARCGQLPVAENRADSNGRKININVAVLPARGSNRSPDPLFYLEGGPGGAGTAEAAWAAGRFKAFNERHDIVLIDQRGTGRSNELGCETRRGISTETEVAEVVKNCLISFEYKADPAQYTTPISADDIDEVRSALGYRQIDVYGVSYGVTLGLAYIQRHGSRVRAALLDSGSMLDFHVWEQVPRSAQLALNRLFDQCRADSACDAAFPNLKTDFSTVVNRLSRGPVQLDIVDPASGATVKFDKAAFGGLVIDAYLATPEGIAAFPKAIHGAAVGDWTAFGLVVESSLTASESIHMMRQTITCGDAWSALDPARVAAVAPESPFTPWEMMFATSQAVVCKYWPHATGASGPVRSSAPVVFLNALSDPVDPPGNVVLAATDMPNSLVVAIAGAGHWQLNYDPTGCLAAKANAFYELGRKPAVSDWNCESVLPAFVT